MPLSSHLLHFLPNRPSKYSAMLQPQTSLLSNLVRGHDNGVMLNIVSHEGLSSRDSALPPWDPKIDKLLRAVDARSIDNLSSLLQQGINVNGHGGAFLETPLHQAARDCWVDGVRFLTEQGASVGSKNHFGQTPLHYGSVTKSITCVKLLLGAQIKDVLDCQDKRGHTPLHDASSVGFVDAISALLKSGASVKVRDKHNETPLHKAARARSIPAMMCLINAGANLDAKDSSGESVLGFTLRHFPCGMESLLDHCILAEPKHFRKKSLEIGFNYTPLVSHEDEESNQMKNLQCIVELGHPALLNHVVCESFLLLKWRKVRYLFFIEVVFYFVYAILTTILTIDKYVWRTPNEFINTTYSELRNISSTETLGIDRYSPLGEVLLAIVLIQAIMISLQQILTAVHGGIAWLMSLWHMFHFIIALFVFLVLPSWDFPGQLHISSILLLLLWTQCMLLIGRFPDCGIYVVMFQRVAKVFLRIFAIYFCLLLAFTFSFYISMHRRLCNEEDKCNGYKYIDVGAYKDVVSTFYKTLTMMIGELNFDEEYAQSLNTVPVVSHLIFLFFVILIAIILSNLLVALAVNDVQALRSSVHLERLIKQMELVFQMEENFRTVASLIMQFRLPHTSDIVDYCRYDSRNSKVYLMPYDRRKGRKLCVKSNGVIDEIKIKKELIDHILECVHSREVETKDNTSSISIRRSRRSEYNNNYDLKGNLQQLESNILLQLSTKLDNISLSISDINTRLITVESDVKNLNGNGSESGSFVSEKFSPNTNRKIINNNPSEMNTLEEIDKTRVEMERVLEDLEGVNQNGINVIIEDTSGEQVEDNSKSV